MLCLGPKKSLTSPRLELTAQGVAYRCSKVECEGHSAIQVPLNVNLALIYGICLILWRSLQTIFIFINKTVIYGSVKFYGILSKVLNSINIQGAPG